MGSFSLVGVDSAGAPDLLESTRQSLSLQGILGTGCHSNGRLNTLGSGPFKNVLNLIVKVRKSEMAMRINHGLQIIVPASDSIVFLKVAWY